MREIKFRAWDGIRYTTAGIGFNNSTGELVASPKSTAILEQFTGLLDKNGKEIYEGDVVRMLYFTKDHTSNDLEPRVAVVSWWEIGFATWLMPDKQYCNLNWAQGIGQAEVIGNIHENPELLN